MITWIPWVLLCIVTPLGLAYRQVAKTRGRALAKEIRRMLNSNDSAGLARLRQSQEEAYKAGWFTRWLV